MKTILVVDDSALIRKAIRRILEPLGYQVEEAANGVEALTRLEAGVAVAGIMLDVEMPEMDGLTTLRELRSRGDLPQVPVIMCTTHNSAATITAAIEAGANEYIMKPFDQSILDAKLQGVGV